MHYVKTTFDFLGEFSFKKRESIVLLNHHIFVQTNKIDVLLIYRSFSFAAFLFFLKDKKLKKLAEALKFLTVLSVNSNVFC